jgi:hypothetical protein
LEVLGHSSFTLTMDTYTYVLPAQCATRRMPWTALCEMTERLRMAFLAEKLAVNLAVSLAVKTRRRHPSTADGLPPNRR